MYSNLERYVPDRKPPMGAVRNPYLKINRGLVLDAMMWEGAGTTVEDLSGNGLVGTFGNTPTWVAGKHGSAIAFADADDDYITCGNPLSMQSMTRLSVVCWFNITTKSSFDKLVSKADPSNQGFILGLDGSNKLRFYIGTGSLTPTNVLPVEPGVGEWHQAVGTYNASGGLSAIRLYLDDKPFVDYTKSGTVANTANNLTFGINSVLNGVTAFDGLLGLVAIYNRDLSASEIAELYREPFCGFRWTSIEQLAAYIEIAPPEIKALFMDLSTQLWTIKHSQGIFTRL